MRAPQNSPEILALSNDAQVILACHWLMGSRTTLKLRNQKNVLSKRSAVAMKELINAGIISDEKADDGYAESRTYRLTEKGARLGFLKSMAWVEKHGKGFVFTTKKRGKGATESIPQAPADLDAAISDFKAKHRGVLNNMYHPDHAARVAEHRKLYEMRHPIGEGGEDG